MQVGLMVKSATMMAILLAAMMTDATTTTTTTTTITELDAKIPTLSMAILARIVSYYDALAIAQQRRWSVVMTLPMTQ
jgi:hypothetical protein